jgi:TolB-like protein
MHAARTLLVLTALAAPILAPAQQKKVRIAILDIRALGTDAAKAELLSEVALTEAASIPGVDVIGKSDINSIVGFEKQKQVMGCAEDSTCLAEIGGALGVDYILVGSLGGLGDLFRIDLKLVDAKRAKVRARIGVTVEGKESRLVAAIQKAIHDLVGPMSGDAPAVADAAPRKDPARADTARDARLAARPPAPTITAPERPGTGVSATAASPRRRWAYLSGGTGAALLLGGALAGLQARSAFDAEKKAAASGDLAAYDSNKSKASSMSMVADGLFVAGAAGVGVGTWLFLTSRSAPLALEVAPLPGGAFAAISGGF